MANNSYMFMIEEAQMDENILGVILAGSRARGMENEQSDWDVYILFKNSISPDFMIKYSNSYREKYGNKLKLDLSNKALQTISEFTHYAKIGSTYYYDRYNLVHSKVELDKTDGKLRRILGKIENLTKKEQETIIHQNLGEYISLVYQSIKSYEAGIVEASSRDAAESILYALTSLFALHDRVRPYNKYLEWELAHHPLTLVPWESQVFITMLTQIIKKTDMKAQQMIYIEIEKLARSKGYGYAYDEWGEKIKYVHQLNF